MKKLLSLFLAILTLPLPAQDHLRIGFLGSAPPVGLSADTLWQSLPVQHFSKTDPDSAGSDIPPATFRIGYGTDFLYIRAEIVSDSLIFRDRGYQNGDGMIVVIARPAPGDEPSREFYVLGFTAQPAGQSGWQKKFIWYRNVDLAMTRLNEARFSARQEDHRVILECLIPWSGIYPYHPWLSGDIGLNVAVVKAVGSDRTWYFLKEDPSLQSEQQPRRYVRGVFGNPTPADVPQSAAILSANHIREGENLKVRVAVSPPAGNTLSFRFNVFSGEHDPVCGRRAEIKPDTGITCVEQEIRCSDLAPGGYSLEWSQSPGHSKGTLWFTVLPSISPEELTLQLEGRKASLSPGSYATLRFMIGDAGEELRNLKPYETAYSIRTRLEEILKLIRDPKDLIAQKKGIFRRAFLSAVDTTYRPYTVSVPQDPDPGRRYPLMVFLHGSGQDDREILEFLPDYGIPMIQLAPNGRGTSNCYVTDHAQEDIEEAIEDVIRNYPVDTTRIILAGFSMGGYGVYRTCYEHPRRYRALAVFSGGPDIAVRWIGPDQMNFLDDRNLTPFSGKQLFIFHGTQDFNIPIDETRMLVEKLRTHGAAVTYIEEPVGHESPNQETLGKFREWLKEILTRDQQTATRN
ncbi:MAG TPA: hypothetical protein VMC08_04950 [Bacteroidales bacterium]|nr:hypothetical protein [Bacteroidales bacterium]